MSVGLGLLHHILVKNTPLTILKEKSIWLESFVKKEKILFEFLLEHFSKYNKLPELNTIEAMTGISGLANFPVENLDFWTAKLIERNDSIAIVASTNLITSAMKMGDLPRARDEALKLYSKLSMSQTAESVSSLKNLSKEVLDLHDHRQYSVGLTGITFGINYLDRMTDGIQPTDFVSLCGRPSVGKSYFLLNTLMHAYLSGHKILLVTLEMPASQCSRRLLALMTNLSETYLRLGRLSTFARDRLLNSIHGINRNEDTLCIIEGGLALTVEDIDIHIQVIKPALILIDGAYLLESRKSFRAEWEKVSYATKMLTRYVLKYKIPVMGTYQFNKKGPGDIAHIGLTDAIGQLSTIALSIKDDVEENMRLPRGVEYKILEVIKGRGGERGSVSMSFNSIRTEIKQENVLVDYTMNLDD